MADKTSIEWTDATWNPVTGCSVVSPGCTNCYAMKLAGTRLKHVASRKGLTRDTRAGPVWTGEVRFNEAELLKPLSWRRPRTIFVCAHGDLFHESVPDDWIDRVFAVMALCPQHTFQVLTKRSARMREFVRASRATPVAAEAFDLTCQSLLQNSRSTVGAGVMLTGDIAHLKVWPLPNVWLGVSAEDQTRADERIPDLLATPAAIRFVSAEPLLGPIDVRKFMWPVHANWPAKYRSPADAIADGAEVRYRRQALVGAWCTFLDWVIVGGESGLSARPMHPDWARSIRDQCQAAGTAFFFKQWGAWGPDTGPMAVGDPIMDGKAECAVWEGDRWSFHRNGYAPDLSLAGREWLYRLGKKAAGRILDGIEHSAMPSSPLAGSVAGPAQAGSGAPVALSNAQEAGSVPEAPGTRQDSAARRAEGKAMAALGEG